MVEANGANLVFLLSTPRAGSTLLGAILGNHSRVLCPNEPWLLVALRGMTSEKSSTLASSNENLAAIALRELLEPDEFVQAARAFALAVYNQKLACAKKSVFVDKTPRYALLLPFLDQVFPAAKKVWLQRNPLDVALSFASTWNIPVAELVGETLTLNSFDLTLGLHNYVNYFHNQSNTFELRYEDLVLDSARTTAALCAFLEIQHEPGIEHYGAEGGTLSEMKSQLMGDKKIFAHSRPHAASINRWRDSLEMKDAQKLADYLGRQVFERMGYHETIRELEQRGVRFPSAHELKARLRHICEQADSFVHSIPQQPAAKASKHWWLKLGENVGILPRRRTNAVAYRVYRST